MKYTISLRYYYSWRCYECNKRNSGEDVTIFRGLPYCYDCI